MNLPRLRRAAAAVVCCALLSACGSDAPSTSTPTPTPTPTPTGPGAVASVTVSGSATLTVGESATFSAVPKDANGAVVPGKTPAFSSSDATKLRIDAVSGVAQPLAVGSVVVSATIDGVTGSLPVTIGGSTSGGSLSFVSITAPSTLEVGDTSTATARKWDTTGNETTGVTPVTYSSSDPTKLSVDVGGRLTAIAAGTVTLTASGGGRTASTTVVIPTPAPGLSLSVPATIGISESFNMHATVRDAAGNITHPQTGLTWVSVNRAAVYLNPISFQPFIMGAGYGTSTVSLTYNGQTVTRTVRTTEPIGSASIAGDKTLVVGGSTSLAVVTKSPGGKLLGDKTVTWSTSDASKATVTATGVITGVGAGTATISANVEGTVATMPVTVTTDLGVVSASLANARVGRSYSGTLAAANGSNYQWSLVSGSLPPGLTLSSAGTITGTPTDTGTFNPVIKVTSGSATAQRALSLRVCAASLNLAVGQSWVASMPDSCGITLPAVSNAQYRVAVMPRHFELDATLTKVPQIPSGMLLRATLDNSASSAAGVSAAMIRNSSRGATAVRQARVSAADKRRADDDAAHMQIMASQMRNAPRPTRSALGPRLSAHAALFAADPAPTRTFYMPTGQALDTRLRYVGNNLIFYEVTSGAAKYHTDAELKALSDAYDAYGKPVIDNYFGGLGPVGSTNWYNDGPRSTQDIDGNGKVIIVMAPDNAPTQGIVSFTDRMPQPAHAAAGVQSLPVSNEGEVAFIRYPIDLDLLAHEIKHLSSIGWITFGTLGKSTREDFWIEEGTAVLSGSLAMRHQAGFSDAVEMKASDMNGIPLLGQYTMFYSWRFLNAAPINAVGGTPDPNLAESNCFGSGWLFHTFLMDNYGSKFGGPDALMRALNTTGVSTAGIAKTIGKPFNDLLSEFVTALSVEGYPAAKAAASSRFRSYDLADISASSNVSTFHGWPWAILGSYSYSNVEYKIDASYYTSLSLFDFTSSGSVAQHIDLLTSSGAPLDPALDAVMVVTRLK